MRLLGRHNITLLEMYFKLNLTLFHTREQRDRESGGNKKKYKTCIMKYQSKSNASICISPMDMMK